MLLLEEFAVACLVIRVKDMASVGLRENLERMNANGVLLRQGTHQVNFLIERLLGKN